MVDVFDYQIDPQIGIAYDDYYSYCEVLLMKDNVWSSLDDSNVLLLILFVTLSNTNTDITNTNLSGDLSWSDYCLVLYKYY